MSSFPTRICPASSSPINTENAKVRYTVPVPPGDSCAAATKNKDTRVHVPVLERTPTWKTFSILC